MRGSGLAIGSGLIVSAGGLTAACTSTPVEKGATDWDTWLLIGTDNRIVLHCPRVEMGQQVMTSLSLIVAEELDADWSLVSSKHAPLDDRFGSQRTENSETIRVYWNVMRRLGASARMHLVIAASERWQVDPESCKTHNSYVVHPDSKQKLSYGELAVDASNVSVSSDITFKNASDYRLVGTEAFRRNQFENSEDQQQFVADISVPNMLIATVRHSPKPGGSVRSLQEDTVLSRPGVKAVVQLESAVAVVADSFWNAHQAAKQLEIKWGYDTDSSLNSQQIAEIFRRGCDGAGDTIVSRGDTSVLDTLDGTIVEDYSVPFDAHASIETTACIADVRPHSCEVWAPTQAPWSTYRVARDTGLSRIDRFRERVALKLSGKAGRRVRIHAMPIGGAFGRRLKQDHVRQAIMISKAVKAPVKLQWTREQDMRNDYYRPSSHHRIRAAIDTDKNILAWHYRIAGSGILDHGIDFPYDCVNVRAAISQHPVGIRTGSMRSTAHSPNAFARESFIDELAHKANSDPAEFRLSHLAGDTRLKNVLQIACDLVDWNATVPAGRGRGVAIHPSKGSCVAQIVEVVINDNSEIVIERITCVADCGLVINPDGTRAQIEGAIVFGLSSALKTHITVSDGQIQQDNFDNFSILRLEETPRIDVHLVQSAELPGGVGEIGVPPVAPALANAVFDACGQRLRQLPLRLRKNTKV